MENERAVEILDPEHREAYESLEPVNEACRMGVEALRRRVPESPYPDGDAGVLACPSCGSGEYLHNEDGNRCRFCGQEEARKAAYTKLARQVEIGKRQDAENILYRLRLIETCINKTDKRTMRIWKQLQQLLHLESEETE